eukprot:NODE_171_length_14381_cov_0.662512.p4 type:complete len:348 gc:universal NODE_171_length_14381_cov_0.662512:2397-3440(+)
MSSNMEEMELNKSILNDVKALMAVNDPRGIVDLLQNIFFKEALCPKDQTHGQLNLYNCNTGKRPDGKYWSCKRCRTFVSVRAGSLFLHCKLPLNECLILLKLFYLNTTPKIATRIMNINEKTVLKYYKLFRIYQEESFKQLMTPLGGINGEVEIDEAIFRKRKYNRGRLKVTFWILGIVCRKTKRIITVPVLNRKKSTMMYFITKLVLPGTTIYTDSYKSYNWISLHENNYTHFTINHSKKGVGRFVNPDAPHIKTQLIECMWKHLRSSLPKNGARFHTIDQYLYDFMFRRQFDDKSGNKNELNDIYLNYLQALLSAYPSGVKNDALANGQNFEFFEHWYLIKCIYC